MDGKTLDIGTVAAVRDVLIPVRLCSMILRGSHVLLARGGYQTAGPRIPYFPTPTLGTRLAWKYHDGGHRLRWVPSRWIPPSTWQLPDRPEASTESCWFRLAIRHFREVVSALTIAAKLVVPLAG